MISYIHAMVEKVSVPSGVGVFVYGPEFSNNRALFMPRPNDYRPQLFTESLKAELEQILGVATHVERNPINHKGAAAISVAGVDYDLVVPHPCHYIPMALARDIAKFINDAAKVPKPQEPPQPAMTVRQIDAELRRVWRQAKAAGMIINRIDFDVADAGSVSSPDAVLTGVHFDFKSDGSED